MLPLRILNFIIAAVSLSQAKTEMYTEFVIITDNPQALTVAIENENENA